MKKYKEWISENENERVDHRDLLSPEQLEWCKRNILQEWWVNEKGEVEVTKHLNLESNDIKEIPVQFADVKGDFDCTGCKNLTSLKGAPRRVGGNFSCGGCNSLTSLEGSPVEVRGYYCNNMCVNLTSLKGAPRKVGGWFSCHDCKNLSTLEGAPAEVGENFYATECNSLTSLEGLPKKFKNLYAATPKLPQVEKDFLEDEDLQEKWKKSPLNWKQFIYGGAAKGRKFGL